MACALTKATPGRRLGDVAETSPDKMTTNSPESRGGRHRDVSGSHRNVFSVSLVSATSQQLMETSRRRLRDLLETGKSLQKNRTRLNFPRLPGDPTIVSRRRRGDIAETSPQPAEIRVATRSPPSLQANDLSTKVCRT